VKGFGRGGNPDSSGFVPVEKVLRICVNLRQSAGKGKSKAESRKQKAGILNPWNLRKSVVQCLWLRPCGAGLLAHFGGGFIGLHLVDFFGRRGSTALPVRRGIFAPQRGRAYGAFLFLVRRSTKIPRLWRLGADANRLI